MEIETLGLCVQSSSAGSPLNKKLLDGFSSAFEAGFSQWRLSEEEDKLDAFTAQVEFKLIHVLIPSWDPNPNPQTTNPLPLTLHKLTRICHEMSPKFPSAWNTDGQKHTQDVQAV